MIKTSAIQLKAAFLLCIFSLNMFVGFACAIGVDMGFNAHHHEHEEAVKVHTHKDGKKHRHEGAGHENRKDDCCNDKVVKIAQTDKQITQLGKLISPVFTSTFLPEYNTINITYPSQVITSYKYFVRGHHPPISDIRIAIQSFQI